MEKNKQNKCIERGKKIETKDENVLRSSVAILN